MEKKNTEIRMLAKNKKIELWRVAEAYGLSDCNFSKLLRRELPEKKRLGIMKIIDQLTAEKEMEE